MNNKPKQMSRSPSTRHMNETVNETTGPVSLRTFIDTDKVQITRATVRNDEAWNRLLQRMSVAKNVRTWLKQLVTWPRLDVERLIARLTSCPQELVYIVDSQQFTSLSQAIVKLLQSQDVEKRDRWLEHLTLVIALRAIDKPAGGEEARELREAYRNADLTAPNVGELKSAINQLRVDLVAATPPQPVESELQQLFRDHPVVSSLVIPAHYQLSKEGILRRGELISETPILVIGLIQPMNNTAELWQVAVFRDGQVRVGEYPPRDLLQSRNVMALADQGADLTGETANQLVRWLRDFRNANADRLPRLRGTSQLGHNEAADAQGLKSHAFLLGNRVLTGATENATTADWRFTPRDVGDKQWATHWHALGTLKGWREGIAPALEYPIARFCVLAALAAPLLEILNADNFVISLCGNTSTGKSTALQLTASVWGRPNPRIGIIRSWNTTTVGIERAMSMLRGLPLIVDEAQLINPVLLSVETVFYSVVQGQGRGRGTIQGQAELPSFSTVLVTCGEASLVEQGNNQGLVGRVIEIEEPPFGSSSESTRRMIDNTIAVLEQNYGGLGPVFVQYLLRNREHWSEWNARYRELVTEENAALPMGSDSHFRRLARSLAVIRLAAEIVVEASQLKDLLSDPVPELRDRIYSRADVADKFEAVREQLMNQVQQNRQLYPYRSELHSEGDGFHGAVEDHGRVVYFLPEAFRSIVEGHGLQVSGVLRSFAHRGWLVMEKASSEEKPTQRRFKVQRKLGDDKLAVHAVRVPDTMHFGGGHPQGPISEAYWSSKKSKRRSPQRRVN